MATLALEIWFLAFFEDKMTKIDILNPKLIVPDDYQQFWVHFEWFLSPFSNFQCIIATVTVKAKSMQKWYFLDSNPIFKKISHAILVPSRDG